ncbi:MAG: hypothetical protein NT007_08435 [Candidatus Kapabacteria bacterium]|nr:hypothetical protein [Candidatus Kapabacteria bacterium]
MQIFSIEGEKLIERKSSDDWESSDDLKIDVSALPVGIYILKAGAKVQKFVKM